MYRALRQNANLQKFPGITLSISTIKGKHVEWPWPSASGKCKLSEAAATWKSEIYLQLLELLSHLLRHQLFEEHFIIYRKLSYFSLLTLPSQLSCHMDEAMMSHEFWCSLTLAHGFLFVCHGSLRTFWLFCILHNSSNGSSFWQWLRFCLPGKPLTDPGPVCMEGPFSVYSSPLYCHSVLLFPAWQ